MDSHAFYTSFASLTFIVLSTALVLHLLYRLALPKPIPGIPYNESSARNPLGDVPAIASHITKAEGTFITYITSTMKSLDAPLAQVFIRPLSKPLLVLADFREAHDILVHRKDFDRSSSLGDLVKGLAPDHHIHLKTNAAWKVQRRLVQDLMTPSFLNNVAGPVIYQHATVLIDLWRAKNSIAEGRPWSASEDTNHVALDAMMAFAFGEGFEHSATRSELETLKGLDANAVDALRGTGRWDLPIEFARQPVDKVLQAMLDLTETVGEVQGNPLPGLTWAYVMRKPRIKKASRIKEDYIMKELKRAVARLEASEGEDVRSAVDHMLVRQKGLAEKNGRIPDCFSRVMIDEIFGFVFAGHETVSTTISWGLKFLADCPAAQTKLRTTLQASLVAAKSEGRSPTIQDITGTHIPYLDATMEEILRCAGTAPLADRQAMVDTELLGYRIPKGTVVSCLVTGPSMMSPSFKIDEARRSPTSRAAKKEGRDRAWDPERISVFEPERWLVAGERGDEFDAGAGPQLAFGLGTRGCYGKRLAYLELRIVLTLIVWNFELLPCPPALSGYKAVLITTNEPTECYVRLRQVDLGRS